MSCAATGAVVTTFGDRWLVLGCERELATTNPTSAAVPWCSTGRTNALHDKGFWQGVASSVVSSLITAYVLFVAALRASVTVAAKGPAGSEVRLGASLITLRPDVRGQVGRAG